MSLTHADVGHRVVVRSRVPGESGPTGGPAFTDVIGVLETWEEGTLCVRHASGRLVRVAEELVVAGKRVPPPPPRR